MTTDAHIDAHIDEGVAPLERRAAALRDALVDRGVVTAEAVEASERFGEEALSPANGARVVARAWVDDVFRAAVLADATAAARSLGLSQVDGWRIVAVENTATVHNVIVCTQCSCTAWPLLGLPPDWYKSPPYRARVVREARTLLADMGLPLGDGVTIRVWDTSGDTTYMVLPERPVGTDHLDEEQLAALVTREALIGVAKVIAI